MNTSAISTIKTKRDASHLRLVQGGKLEALKAAIANGSYQIDSGRLAQTILPVLARAHGQVA